MAKTRKGGLGKGLDALFADNNTNDAGITTLRISDIEPNRDQPRKNFEPEALQELADSIKEHGVLQPLIVRPIPGGGYQLVAGERRWRASRLAELSEVPVVVREMTDQQVAEVALIENLQREDLNPVEEARGYQALIEQYGCSKEEVASRVGKSRPVISNAIRLLGLPEDVLSMVSEGKISSGHARALLSLEDRDLIRRTAKDIPQKGMSVRDVERLGASLKKAPRSNKAAEKEAGTVWGESFFSEMELALSQSLGRKVKISGSQKSGALTIEFYSREELEALAKKLTGGW